MLADITRSSIEMLSPSQYTCPSPDQGEGLKVCIYGWCLINNFDLPVRSEERDVFSFIHIIKGEGRV